MWRKHRLGKADAVSAQIAASAFEADYFGAQSPTPAFAVMAVTDQVLNKAASLAAREGLRAYDAVQLSTALALRELDPQCDSFACFDSDLRVAAAKHTFRLIPVEE